MTCSSPSFAIAFATSTIACLASLPRLATRPPSQATLPSNARAIPTPQATEFSMATTTSRGWPTLKRRSVEPR